MSSRRLCSKARSCGEEPTGRRAGGAEFVDEREGNRRRIRPGELEGATAMVSGLVIVGGSLVSCRWPRLKLLKPRRPETIWQLKLPI
jgi:hypothetical protein